MNNEVEVEGRPRPLSTGLWNLFSWLRRDEKSISDESLSSAGSDRTVASFAFLTPTNYVATTPLVLPPPGPPTDSYKKRVHDRNIRRQHDRDLTLHRKYGLYKCEGTCSYDAFSLPPVRRIKCEGVNRWDRERRATSECYHRRLAHVPGKRRAPLPPVPTTSTTLSPTLKRTRKRPAPQPPEKDNKTFDKVKENLKIDLNTIVPPMNSNLDDKHKIRNNEVRIVYKSEKYNKKEATAKDAKIKTEKSFLKQIFDGKKRNSSIDTASVKVLPSISELDKQAAEIIETYKLKALDQNRNTDLASQISNHTESWLCVRCLKKYDSSIATCASCLPDQKEKYDKGALDSFSKSSSCSTQTEIGLRKIVPSNKSEDKQKLKEMLKEMKDSLPKRSKHDVMNKAGSKSVITPNSPEINLATEMPTLRVGSTQRDHKIEFLISKPTTSKYHISSPSTSAGFKLTDEGVKNEPNVTEVKGDNKISEILLQKPSLHTPLKISSLLNPMYVPKNLVRDSTKITTISTAESEIGTKLEKSSNINKEKQKNIKALGIEIATEAQAIPSTSQTSMLLSLRSEDKHKLEMKLNKQEPTSSQESSPKTEINLEGKIKNLSKLPAGKDQHSSNVTQTHDQHSRRRDLINQLEKSIARGDENAAADAAAKLAQLRLSCSVLSFTSQILARPSTSSDSSGDIKVNNIGLKSNNETPLQAVNTTKHTSSQHCTVTTSSVLAPNKVTSSPLLKAEAMEVPKNKETNEEKPIIKKNAEILKDETPSKEIITIAVLVEDREATRGPVQLHISRQALMRDLRREAEISLGLAANLQRWIVGRALCVDDNTLIASLAGTDFSAPFYLCVVESEMKVENLPNKNNLQIKASNVYSELMQLEQQALVPNAETFDCEVCMEEYPPGQGVVLRECVHTFCKECLSDLVRHCEEPNISCPAMGCSGMLQEREIRALVSSQEYERWLARGLTAAESGTRNAFHCRTRDCKGWALCEPGVQRFPCQVCNRINCVPCQIIHENESCEQYQEKLKKTANNKVNADETDDGTRTLLNSLIRKGEALECPECNAIITKKWGCDWVKCSACKTEICWVTRGRRWGPAGKGDTSAGCRCGVDGKRCHPSCGYCH